MHRFQNLIGENNMGFKIIFLTVAQEVTSRSENYTQIYVGAALCPNFFTSRQCFRGDISKIRLTTLSGVKRYSEKL